ncbi:putative phosphoglycerate mutase family protein [Xylaria flabelliformis]|nr:putative phosphoglycerate mutase family protein [Xylaria flabelliformis]
MHFPGAFLFAGFAATVVTAKPTVYLIRHGEKPADGSTGLSAQGVQRAQCLRTVFGAASAYDIGYILAQTPDSGEFYLFHNLRSTVTRDKSVPALTKTYWVDGTRARPYLTVEPLATDLGLTVDTTCDRDDEQCVQDLVDGYTGNGNILICWEHKELNNIAEQLGANNVDNYPDDSYNLIWTQPYDYDKITSITSENCPGLDS